MSDRKSGDNETGPGRQMVVMHDRRMEEVRKNFAVGIQRIVADKSMSRGHGVKTRQRNTA
ncbi:MAG TPA: hypothetical protein DDX85_09275 [Nitrospiraceae bacterium]|nr:hypothetical protein [Nitrospiraceae bacterium]